MSLDQNKKDLALGIVDFLTTAVADGTISADDKDSVDVAIECLTEVFQISLDDKQKVYGNQDLLSIFGAFKKLQARKADAASTSQAEAAVSDEDKAKAEQFKLEGNRAIAQRDYPLAIDKYTQALALNPDNAIYLSNRAAAYSNNREHEKAVADAKKALELDPSYTKAYSRLGLAHYALGNAQASMDAYKKGLDSEGDSPSDAMKRGYETAKKRVEEQLDAGNEDKSAAVEPTTRSTDAGAGAGAGAGGFPGFPGLGGGAGGFPDLSALMNNPQIAQMAQNLMSNPGALSSLMNNPQIAEMAKNMQNGNTPNFSEMMNNPALQDMAKNFMGGAGKK
jgi:small glutamine-rich tetratricopeptide repeat-containing protein alpha